jgi:hypothetical protein
MKHWSVPAVLAAMALFSQSALAIDFKAQRDFSYQNPSGVWSYGTRTPITAGPGPKAFTKFSGPLTSDCVPGFDCWKVGVNTVGTNTTGRAFNDPASSTVVVGNNLLQMHPTNELDTVVLFEAPVTGSYRFEGYFQILDTNPNSVMTFIVRGRNDFLFRRRLALRNGNGAATRDDKNPKPGRAIRFDFQADDIQAGDLIAFGVNADGNYLFDSTGFDAKITLLP